MSKKKRAIEKQKKQNSEEQKRKRAKKAEYASHASYLKWEDKKARKEQSQLNRREALGVSRECPLVSWEQPSIEKCNGCQVNKCSFKTE